MGRDECVCSVLYGLLSCWDGVEEGWWDGRTILDVFGTGSYVPPLCLSFASYYLFGTFF